MAWDDLRRAIERRTDRVVSDVRDRWDGGDQRGSFSYGPVPHDPDEPPSSVAEQVRVMGGLASVITFYRPSHRETVLVYNASGGWEPPGGRIEPDQTPEEAARAEAREETGLDVQLTDLAYTRRFDYVYASGERVELPVVVFVGHRTDGTLAVERDGRTHPGVCRATGLFDRETLPTTRRDADRIRDLLNDPPAWNPDE